MGYRAGSELDRGLYRLGLKRRVKLPVPVISVGNITAGGTGKTPFVEFLAGWLEANGRRVAILSRGYGRVRGRSLDDETLDSGSPRIARFTHARRLRLARKVIRDFKPDILLLDDGFQHHAILRDLDLVLVDALDPFSNGHLLPRGLLREPPSSLRRADMVVISRSDQVGPTRLETIRKMLVRVSGGRPVLEAVHRPVELQSLSEGRSVPLEWLRTRRLVAFCGIGNPEAFRITLESVGANVVSHVVFPDHHPYRPEELRNLGLRVKEFMAEGLITTRKDAVRLPGQLPNVPVFVLKIRLQVTRGAEELRGRLSQVAGLAAAHAEPGLATKER